MISVSIFINGNPIFTRTAVNISPASDGSYSTYELDTGKILKHKRKDGAVKLAIKMLKTIKERSAGDK
jgi:hypothetical protein